MLQVPNLERVSFFGIEGFTPTNLFIFQKRAKLFAGRQTAQSLRFNQDRRLTCTQPYVN